MVTGHDQSAPANCNSPIRGRSVNCRGFRAPLIALVPIASGLASLDDASQIGQSNHPTETAIGLTSYRIPILLAPLAIAPLEPRFALPAPSPVATAPLPIVRANNNRVPAGHLADSVMTIRLVVRMARWYPESLKGPYADVAAFAEEGKAPQIPAPLIRVRTGTTVVATIRNALTDSTVYLRGFMTRPAATLDSIALPPGQSRTIRFSAGAPGTYLYTGIPGSATRESGSERQQLGGAFVVDPEGPVLADRIFVVNIWGQRKDAATYLNALAINGKSWPFTERISTTEGDTLRWRVINASARVHPMHLHGFYFRVASRGGTRSDSVYAPGRQSLAVTEDMSGFSTMSMAWTPDRPGNWLFHCHLAFHVVPGTGRLSAPAPTRKAHSAHSSDPGQHMSGLVIGIKVLPARGSKATSRENVRILRLFVNEGRRRSRAPRALGYVLQQGDKIPAIDSVEIPGSVIVLTKNEPTDIVVVNRLREPTSVHWHGIELESYSDGVPGWSGMADRLAPMIAPGDSFTARLTLPRAGTFIYHTHINDIEQITSGLYGAIVVLEQGQKFDPATDHVIVNGWDGEVKFPTPPKILVNGDSVSPPMEIAAGVPHRFRFINIGPAARMLFAMRRDSTVLTWRALAKDGVSMTPEMAVIGPSIRLLNVGEMFDAEFVPPGAGEYRLTVGPSPEVIRYSRRVIAR